VDTAPLVLNKFAELIKQVKIFDAVEINNAIQQVRAIVGVKGRKLYMPIRIGTTRATHGPAIAESIELLGREKTMHHLEVTLAELNH
ncbi:MAG: glutamate--tRNA ligase, partial [Loigolactobacillus coryniformis]|nr:glutamate--tRNA ligase [Loigolactobacillus coryniformis]